MTDSDYQSEEEAYAHVLSDAAGVARLYLDALVTYGRLDAAQAVMTPEFRLARAQIWIWNNRNAPDVAGRDLDELASGLAAGDRAAHLWRDFAIGELALYSTACAEWWGRVGTASRPRPVAPDLEVVLFADMDELRASGALSEASGMSRVVAPTGLTRVCPVLVETRDGVCYVAGHGEEPHTPGWPPSGY